MIEEDIKTIIVKDVKELQPQLLMDVVKQYLFDKTGEVIPLVLPTGQISFNATKASGSFVFDTDLLAYYYHCAVLYYKNKFNLKDVGNGVN